MSSNNSLVLKYSVLGSTVLTMAGCSLSPRVADIVPIQTIQPDKNRLAQANRAEHKTTLQTPRSVSAKPAVTTLDKVALCALKQCGKGYCWGGNSPMKGFDCSGLTQYSFGQGASVSIPRTAAAQYKVAVKVPQEHAGRGDLVFFRTRGKRVSHVGIYLGENRFVHAPRTGKAITTTKLEGYWKRRLVGFGRIPGASQPLLPRSVI